MNKEQFMQTQAKREWDNPDCPFVNESVAEYLGFKKVSGETKFDKLPKKLQKALGKFAEWELGYSDDWETKQQEMELVA